MAFQPIPDTASARLIYNFGSGPDLNNVIHVRDITTAWTEAKLSNLGDTIQAWWDTEVQPLQVDDLTLTSIDLKDESEEFGQRVIKTVGLTGALVTTPAPAVVAAIVKFQGDPGNPPRQGRLFHPGLTEAQITEGALDGTFVSDLATAYEALPVAITAGVASEALVLVSRYQGSELVAGPQGQTLRRPVKREEAETNTISGVSVPTRYGVQKRRRPSPF
jgi:hypothetical protein